jgi:hypothetical protein
MVARRSARRNAQADLDAMSAQQALITDELHVREVFIMRFPRLCSCLGTVSCARHDTVTAFSRHTPFPRVLHRELLQLVLENFTQLPALQQQNISCFENVSAFPKFMPLRALSRLWRDQGMGVALRYLHDSITCSTLYMYFELTHLFGCLLWPEDKL